MTTDGSLLIEHTDGIVTLTLNRPDSLNSLNRELKEALRDTLAGLDEDPQCRAVLITGAGRGFCAGQDLREHVATLDSGTTDPLASVREHFNPIATLLAGLGKPVVAAVRGMAAGAGASLALLADFRIGGPSTSFLMAFANVGLCADTGATWSLPRLVGHAKATELLLLAEPVKAAEAARLGLLTSLVETDDDVLPAARALASRLASGPTVAYGAIKRALAVAEAGTLTDALAAEMHGQWIAGATEDHRAATAAFVAKQRPIFEGR
jgi:2-(1,2-epoxy-1,2-dihydrophenyl)acetyl-CoA isomerase